MAGDTPRGDAETSAANASEQPNAGTPSAPNHGAGHGKATHRALILGAIGVVAIAVIARYRNELIAAFEAGIEALRMARGG